MDAKYTDTSVYIRGQIYVYYVKIHTEEVTKSGSLLPLEKNSLLFIKYVISIFFFFFFF